MHHILQYIFYYFQMFCALCKYDIKPKKNELETHHTIYTINRFDPLLMYTHNPHTIYNT